MKKFFKNIGPGPLIAAAFIGPGTVTVCTLAGAKFEFSLLWVMVLAVVVTIILQEMTARLGLVSQKGLAEVLTSELKSSFSRYSLIVVVLSAIVLGNAAYEGGNISGGTLGLEIIFGTNKTISSIIVGAAAFVLLFLGNYKILERILIGLVVLMSLAFVITAIITKPDMSAIINSIFSPKFPVNSTLLVLGLIGTTIVPYNLFLHAALVKEKWQNVDDLKYVRKDTFIAVVLGGLVSMSIIIASAAMHNANISSATDLAKGLAPLFGGASKYVLAIGLFSAGITSAITAPLAAAYVASECFGWENNLKSIKFRSVWMLILCIGVAISASGFKPIQIIKFAQVANALLLPLLVGLLLWIMNRKELLGVHKNSIVNNILAGLVFILSLLLSFTGINKVFDLNIL